MSKFLEEFQAVDILTGIIDKSKAPRVTVSLDILSMNISCVVDIVNTELQIRSVLM